MKGRGLAALVVVVALFMAAHHTQAEMTQVIVNGYTLNDASGPIRQMQIWVQVLDTVFSRGPDFVASISVAAPDGSVLSLHHTADYLHQENAYFKGFDASFFKKGKIPSGIYSVTVTSLSGEIMKESNWVDAGFMDPPSITSPSPGETVGETPIFTWTAPQGATYYRLWIWDATVNEPVYWWFGQQLRTGATSVEIPRGALKPNRDYSFRVEARAGTIDIDKRSRCAWINFRTD